MALDQNFIEKMKVQTSDDDVDGLVTFTNEGAMWKEAKPPTTLPAASVLSLTGCTAFD